MTDAVTEVRHADAADATTVLRVIGSAFGDRPALDPPATALEETLESVGKALASHGGLLATVAGEPAGTLLFEPRDHWLGLRRVGLLGNFRGHGVGAALVSEAERFATEQGYVGIRLLAREELPATIRFWTRQGYVEVERDGPNLRLRKLMPFDVVAPTAEDTQQLGHRLAALVRAGDLLILTGDLGAGKTTLAQGLGAGLGVRGPITSPTFVISRVHPSLVDGPALVHVDAYRLDGLDELDALDLDTDLDAAVTVVEWGAGLAETLTGDRLELTLVREDEGECRRLRVAPVGGRWIGTDLRTALA